MGNAMNRDGAAPSWAGPKPFDSFGRDDDDPLAIGSDPARLLPARLSYWANLDPDRPFVTEVGSRSLTYGAFDLEVRRCLCWLGRLGVRDGTRVASMLPGSIESYAVWIACTRAGALEVSVNPDLRGGFLRHVLTDSQAELVLVRPESSAEVRLACPDLTVVEVGREAGVYANEGPATGEPAPCADDASCVIYTSGTTGAAKGVVISHGQLAAIIGRLPRTWVSGDDIAYSPWPVAHVTGRSPLVSMVDVGGQVIVRERFSLSDFWADVHHHYGGRRRPAPAGPARQRAGSRPPPPLRLVRILGPRRRPLRPALRRHPARQLWQYRDRFSAGQPDLPPRSGRHHRMAPARLSGPCGRSVGPRG